MSESNAVWPYPRLIAHRGAGRLAPENTLAAVRAGARHGFAMVEYDVKLSKDGVAILLHDDRLERTSNGQGCAADKTLKELARLDFGAWHSKAYAGEPAATLYAVAAFTLANGMASNIEIKPHPGTDAETGAEVARLARQLWSGASVPPLLSSFSETALQAARDAAHDLPRALLIEGDPPRDWQSRLDRLGCIGLNMDHRHATRQTIGKVRAAGYKIAIFTVNDRRRAQELLDWGCDAIFTDEIAAMAPGSFP